MLKSLQDAPGEQAAAAGNPADFGLFENWT